MFDKIEFKDLDDGSEYTFFVNMANVSALTLKQSDGGDKSAIFVLTNFPKTVCLNLGSTNDEAWNILKGLNVE